MTRRRLSRKILIEETYEIEEDNFSNKSSEQYPEDKSTNTDLIALLDSMDFISKKQNKPKLIPDNDDIAPEIEDSVNEGIDKEKNRVEKEDSDKSQELQLPERFEFPEISNKPEEILSAWLALEILSPPTFENPEKLAIQNNRSIIYMKDDPEPWDNEIKSEDNSINSKNSDFCVFYQVILGSIDFEESLGDLIKIYADVQEERPKARGKAILAAVTIDEDGNLIENSPISISSFVWGLANCLKGNLKNLSDWSLAEDYFTKSIQEMLDENSKITYDTLEEAFYWLVDSLDLPERMVSKPYFVIKTYVQKQKVLYKEDDEEEKEKEKEEQEKKTLDAAFLNSFFLRDLNIARDLFKKKESEFEQEYSDVAPDNLRRYLQDIKPGKQEDLLASHKDLEKALAPELFPSSCWPGYGHHPLVLLQQAGVNLAMNRLKHDGILAINGPPGTGKTTLLRDIIAEIVTNRAKALARFSNPESAFTNVEEKFLLDSGSVNLYRLDESIIGHEILIASSNNKAVENVSCELPAIGAIADDIDLKYFKTISDNLIGKDSWGLIAGVLGNSKNRNRFKQKFWYDKDFGLCTYLAEISGRPQFIKEIIYEGKKKKGEKRRKPEIIKRENPPLNPDQTLARWRRARNAFREAVRDADNALEHFEGIRKLTLELAKIREQEDLIQIEIDKREDDINLIQEDFISYNKQLSDLQDRIELKINEIKSWKKHHPGLLAPIFRKQIYRDWSKTYIEKNKDLKSLKQQEEAINLHIEAKKKKLSKINFELNENSKQLDSIYEQIKGYKDKINVYRKAYHSNSENNFIDEDFIALDHEDKHNLSPWLDDGVHKLREKVFVEAMNLHKAFIDSAAAPIHHNLIALMNIWDGKSLPRKVDPNLILDLWSSLFLVVPALSTTFASIGTMLSKLPLNSLGWLLIDEAGQALPQSAVGSIMRTKRAIFVGDPMQIEPIVILPRNLTEAICRQFGVDPELYNAPRSSAQTLSESATNYISEMKGAYANRTIGIPLLVHRRCRSIMFNIANSIAYENLMINKKTDKHSAIEATLGKASWFDVKGSSKDKWSPEEGEKVLELLCKLKQNNVKPDLYIVTPFTVVQDNMRNMLRYNKELSDWVGYHWIYERIGTVHTAQGREAEAVIFILGAPDEEQQGARNWAGWKPNLLNVAVTRAKEVIYVVGNRQLWKNSGVFCNLNTEL